MKKYLSLFITILVLASCSSPKYTYNFDYYNYNSGKKKAASQAVVTDNHPFNESTLKMDEKTLVASVKENDVYVTGSAPIISNEEAVTKIKSMSKEEVRELKREVKRYVKEKKRAESVNGNSTKSLEHDVKLAAIFGAVGIVLLIIGGEVLYVLGAIALLVGLYFFIRWLIHQ